MPHGRSPDRRAAPFACLLLASCLLASAARASSAPERTLRVLIVGNSYTRFNVLSHLLHRLSESAPGPRLRVDAEAKNGFSLRMHWRRGEALERIRNGHYAFVVLQDHSLRAIDHPEAFMRDAERFKRVIDAAHARTVLYETWPRHPSSRLYRKHPTVHSFGQMAERLDRAYAELAHDTDAALAKVGGAFERALASDPELTLWGPDGSHPTLSGSFLTACVLYATITGEDPRLASYAPPGISPERALRIKAIAAETALGKEPAAPPADPLRAAQAAP